MWRCQGWREAVSRENLMREKKLAGLRKLHCVLRREIFRFPGSGGISSMCQNLLPGCRWAIKEVRMRARSCNHTLS
jgi:hypothetical protein